MATPAQPAPPQPRRLYGVNELARALDVRRETLSRALRNDPAAPSPADRGDLERPLYDLAPVKEWWPRRRRRGRPAPETPQPPPAADPIETPATE